MNSSAQRPGDLAIDDRRLAEPDRRRPPTTAAGCSGGWAGAGCRWRGRECRELGDPVAVGQACGANTWIRPIALLAMPATTRPMQNARKTRMPSPARGDRRRRPRAPGARRAACRPTTATATTARRRRPRRRARSRIRDARSRRAGPATPGERGRARLRRARAEHQQQAAPADEGRRLVEEGRRRRDVEGDQGRKGDREASEHGEDRRRGGNAVAGRRVPGDGSHQKKPSTGR